VADVLLCIGKDCRKRSGALHALEDLLDDRGITWKTVRCQKICSGPVLGLVAEGKLQWFEKLRGKDARKALERYLDRGRLDALWKRRVKKRAGKRR
jgi:(2Fe-2S) ferredoxin